MRVINLNNKLTMCDTDCHKATPIAVTDISGNYIVKIIQRKFL